MAEPSEEQDVDIGLTREQIDWLASRLRAKREVFYEHGGTRCHCGGLIYPPAESGGPGRYTCTHGGEPLTRGQIGEIWKSWGEVQRG